jgi:hypothetical protein
MKQDVYFAIATYGEVLDVIDTDVTKFDDGSHRPQNTGGFFRERRKSCVY